MSKKLMVDIAVTVERSAVLLIARAKPPFMDRLVLPGGHVEADDSSFAQAAARELAEEVGIVIVPAELHWLMRLDTPGRDPRYDTASVVYHVDVSAAVAAQAAAGSDARALAFYPINELQPEQLGFDHWLAISRLEEVLA